MGAARGMARRRPRAPTAFPVDAVLALVLGISLVGCHADSDVVASGPYPARLSGEPYDPVHPPGVLPLVGDLRAHTPAIVRAENGWVAFALGERITMKFSEDLVSWRDIGSALPAFPEWISEKVPDAKDLWAPDVVAFGDRHHLYYAASTYRSDRSCIGHAVSTTPEEPESFVDDGWVICSNVDASGEHPWNAIDPTVLVEDGVPWLAFGSYLDGIQLLRLNPNGKAASTEVTPIAARPDDGRALQAAALYRRGEFVYLFLSFDRCCMGLDSTHKIVVGRASSVTGPYFDRSERPLLDGGGTLVLEGNERFAGPGSNMILDDGRFTYNVYHAYDAEDGGASVLRIAELAWDEEGWPVSGGP
ncbi:MAG: arabinan endo-1,5-alpha-L-arabinosidase [Pseudomonadota bacterium]|nr:MAG: arabinan endo-1,5-alpha-L-arabinosidase [Pseudomonadota bacterium]